MSPSSSFDAALKDAHSIHDFTVEVRRSFHQIPEIGYKENETSKTIQKFLTNLGVQFTTGWGRPDGTPEGQGTGVVAEIGTGLSPCVMLRSDIDALPVTEQTDVPFKSRHDGFMHACGHDGHMSMLIGAARLLKEAEAQGRLKGTVRLIFQPAEEGLGGAACMCRDRVLEKQPKVDAAFGFHMFPGLPTGVVGSRHGTVLAAGCFFNIVVKGRGGHAALPNLTIDPITATAAIVQAAQTLISRESSPFDSSVLSITSIQAGDACNVVPPDARIRGTMRALASDHLTSLAARLEQLASAIAIAHRCTSTFELSSTFPATVNSPKMWDFIKKECGGGGELKIEEMKDPFMASEDFSEFANRVPAAFMFVGQGTGEGFNNQPKTSVPLHSPYFCIDERALDYGVAMHTHLAISALADPSICPH